MPRASRKSIWTAKFAVRSEELWMLTWAAWRSPTWERGMPLRETSEAALPRPRTFASRWWACWFACSVRAATEASNSSARADAEAAAAEADARAEAMAEEAAEDSGEGGVPVKDSVAGAVGRGVKVAPPPWLLLPPPQAASVRVPAVASTAAAALAPRYRSRRPPLGTPLPMASVPFRQPVDVRLNRDRLTIGRFMLPQVVRSRDRDEEGGGPDGDGAAPLYLHPRRPRVGIECEAFRERCRVREPARSGVRGRTEGAARKLPGVVLLGRHGAGVDGTGVQPRGHAGDHRGGGRVAGAGRDHAGVRADAADRVRLPGAERGQRGLRHHLHLGDQGLRAAHRVDGRMGADRRQHHRHGEPRHGRRCLRVPAGGPA
ncbi:hypothetical protein SGPA1_50814 [Streptomyces misionensis JCM 4497]